MQGCDWVRMLELGLEGEGRSSISREDQWLHP